MATAPDPSTFPTRVLGRTGEQAEHRRSGNEEHGGRYPEWLGEEPERLQEMVSA